MPGGLSVVALTRSLENACALAVQGIEPAIADVFDAEAVKRPPVALSRRSLLNNSPPYPEPTPVSRRVRPPQSTVVSAWKGAPTCWQRRKRRVCGVTRGSRSHSLRFLVLDWQMKQRLLATDTSPAVADDAR